MKNDLLGKKILVLGGKPIGSCDIVNYAKELGVHSIVTDFLTQEKSPAKKISDEFWNISTSEIEKLREAIVNNKVDAVFTGSHDFNIRMACEICSLVGLPFYATEDQLLKTTLKSFYKKLFQSYNIPVVPEFYIDQNFNKDDLKKIKYPVLIKPADGTGGNGISICKKESDLKNNFQKAIQFSLSKKVIVEKYINAKEVTIFYIIQNGEIYLSAMADRFTSIGIENLVPLPVAYIFPSKHLQNYLKFSNEKVIEAFRSLGLKNGMLFIQSFVDEDKFIFYDIGFRLTGTQEYNIIEEICGYNPLKMLVDFSLTGQMGVENISHLVDPYFKGKYACIITFLCKPCTVGEFVGIDKISIFPEVIKVVVNHNIGDIIPESAIGTLNQIILRVFAITDSKSKMKKLITSIISNIDILSETGNSVLLPAFDIHEF
jgi:biotin carboxylase